MSDEGPAERHGSGRRRLLVGGAVGVAVVVAVSVALVVATSDRPGAAPGPTAQAASGPVASSGCSDGASGACVLHRAPAARGTVVLWGDQRAAMLGPALEHAATRVPTTVVAFTMAGCLPATGSGTEGSNSCRRLDASAFGYVSRLARLHEPVRVVLSADWTSVTRPADLPFAQLEALRIPVDAVGPTPVLTCSAGSSASCDESRSSAIPDEDDVDELLRRQLLGANVTSRLIDVTPSLCDDTTCYSQTAGTVDFASAGVISPALSSRLSRYFVPSLRELARR